MSLEDRVMELYAESNPFPSAESLGLVAEEATEYLASLDARSSEVTRLETRYEEETNRSRSVMPWLAAALLAVVAGVAIILMTNDSETPVATTPTTIVESAPTTVATPTTVAESAPADVATWLELSGPGTYRPMRFGLPFVFTLTEGSWETGVNGEAEFALCGPDVEGPVGARSACYRASAVAVFLLGLGTVEETQSYLETFPDAEITDVEPVSIDGAAGVRFSFAHSLQPHSAREGGYGGYPYWAHEAQEIPLGADQSIVSIVDVGGTVVTVVYQGRAISEPTPFETNLEEGMAIIDSIVWGDLP